MPQLALAAAGAAIGGVIAPGVVGLGLTGSAIGWGLGSLAGALLFRPDSPTPQMGDLTAPKLTYGTPIPRVWGTVLVSGSLAWCSAARPVEETAGGKGGGDQVVGYRYYRDMMFTVAVDSDVTAIRRVQRNGKWVWSADATATAETLQASAESAGFDDIELLDGNPAQVPHPIYEAAVGAANASAYRYSTNIFLTNVDCGNSPTPPAFLFEITSGVVSELPALTKWQTISTTNDNNTDISWFANGTGPTWTNADIAGDAASPMLFESIVTASVADLQYVYSLSGNPGVYPDTASDNWDDVTLIEDMVRADVADWHGVAVGTLSTVVYSESTSPSADPWRKEFTASAWYIPGSNYLTGSNSLVADAPHFSRQLFKYTQTDSTGATHEHRIRMTGYVGNMHHGDGETRVFLIYRPPGGAEQTFSIGAGTHRISVQVTTGRLDLWVNGEFLYTTAVGIAGSDTSGRIEAAVSGGYAVDMDVAISESRIRYEETYTPGANFSTTMVLPPPDAPSSVVTPAGVDLADVVTDICEWALIQAAMFDVSDLVGTNVRGFATSAGPRGSLEQLASVFAFGAVAYDALTFVARGGSSAASIAYADMGAGVDEAAEEALELTRGNDGEIARIAELTYPNWNADHETGSVRGDRGSGDQNRNSSATVAVVLTPAEAQRVADAWALDGRAAGTSIRLAVTDDHARVGPTDIVTLTDQDATTYRARVVAEDFAAGVKAWELVLDDASIFTQQGVASDYTTPTIQLPASAAADWLPLDLPLLRDADNDSGYYGAVFVDGDTSAQWFESNDGTTYSGAAQYPNDATFGSVNTVSGTPRADNTFDEGSSLTVSVNGTLSSSTRAALLADRTVNACAVGVQGRYVLGQFRTATLVSTGVYTLTGWLWGARGTEQYAADVVAGDDFALLASNGGIKRLPRTAAQLGVAFYTKAVTAGVSVASVTGTAFTNNGEALKPRSPVRLRAARDASTGDITLSWTRRTRFDTRFGGPLGDACPLGEDAEQYRVRVYTSNTYATLARDLGTVTTASATYTAAQQTTDFGSAQSTVYVQITQLSSAIGEGHYLRAAA